MNFDKDIIELKTLIEEHEQRIAKLEAHFQEDKQIPKKKLSIKEFIISKQPKNDIERTLTIGFYLENHAGMQSFNRVDLENGFRSAKEPVPENINYKVIKNVEKGFMMEAEEKKKNFKAWVLTNSGEKHVQNNFRKE